MDKNFSRRGILKAIASLFAIPSLFLWFSGTKRKLITSENHIITLSADLNDGITIKDDIIIFKEAGEIKIYSSRCTHLGCRITSVEKERLVCPCHGSSFAFNGEVIQGPASQSLRVLKFSKNAKNNALVVYVS